MKKRNRKYTVILILAALVLTIWIAWGNTALELNTYILSSKLLPKSFDGYRIAHVSDLHNAQMGVDNEKLLCVLKDAQPDLIAITGDLIDSRNTDTEVALRFVQEAVKIAPCFYVTGNHEARVAAYNDFKSGLKAAGVIVLEDEYVEITQSGEHIAILGVDDPSFETDYLFGDSETVMHSRLNQLKSETNGYTVLLSHRPELFEVYVSAGMDLVLSGHAHGGQFRLPFVGGLVAPNQGFFPAYDAGLYTDGNTNMIVSRGIGNSIIPFRFNNRPEVILIMLQCEG